MGIELGSVGTAIGNVASGIGKAGPSLESMFGPKMGPVGLPVNEGPAGLGGLINPIEKISFNAPREGETISSVEGFLAQARMPEPKQSSQKIAASLVTLAPRNDEFVQLMAAPWALPLAEPMAGPAVEVQPKLQPATQTESRVSVQPAAAPTPAVLPQPLPQEQEEEEEVITEKVTTEQPDMIEEEEVNKVVRKHVVDDGALSRVVVEIKHALVKAQELAKKSGLKLTGELISKFIPGQHPGNESEVVKGGGADGSIPERRQSIEELGELSDVQAEEKAITVAYEKPPIKIRSEGKQVGDEDIQRVYRYHRVKPKALMEMVTRVIKKKKLVAQMGHETIEVPIKTAVPEKKIEDYPQLAGVFPKAA